MRKNICCSVSDLPLNYPFYCSKGPLVPFTFKPSKRKIIKKYTHTKTQRTKVRFTVALELTTQVRVVKNLAHLSMSIRAAKVKERDDSPTCQKELCVSPFFPYIYMVFAMLNEALLFCPFTTHTRLDCAPQLRRGDHLRCAHATDFVVGVSRE